MDWTPQVETLCAQLTEHYVFPEVGVEIAEILRKRLAAGAYAGISGDEELAYDLQTRDRATIVGERTKGGANPGGRYYVGPHLKSAVPSGRAVNPVRNDNWEGVGVAPDIEATAEEAFGRAYGLALWHVLTLGEDGARRAVAAEAREALAALQ
ncbi:Peptidase family S41 [Streptosporangium canum]|uniref:Peptidase family S41 n=2 Tax=Streptosporangium canum TaxID=324952 RepID=A0A1I3IV97_9ACTN|nr:Peptidase family S41 [Streptosporangium canum]